MDFAACRKFLEKLRIRDRDSGHMVPFRLNPNQLKIQEAAEKLQRKNKPVWLISVKSRRVGFSSWAEGIGFCHCLAHPNANGLVLAHQASSAKELFKIPLGLARDLPFPLDPPPTQHKITFPLKSGHSYLSVATAGSSSSGRGWTLSFLHLSEAAFYPEDASFEALLPAVSYSPDTILVIESTANGMVYEGKAFYEMWQAAEQGQSEFTPIFLSWLDDPACVRDPEEARDAPIDADEKDLLKMGATIAQLAWRRWCLDSRCGGRIETFNQEYPATASLAFVSSGNPCFDSSEIRWAESTIHDPIWSGMVESDARGTLTRTDHSSGPLFIWHLPEPNHHYYIGADAARGSDSGEEGAIGDFAAAVVIDGTTGEVAARFAERWPPERFADMLDGLGRFYNRAMLNIELTGNLGLEVQRRLRDDYRYPNLYKWKGKDDRAYHTRRFSLGWETNSRTRPMAMNMFRAAIREGSLVELNDKSLLIQMKAAVMEDANRWEVIERLHDDILMAALLANAARVQYPPPILVQRFANNLDADGSQRPMPQVRDDVSESLKRHYDSVTRAAKKEAEPARLLGV